ncbi:MAG TPA: glutathione S-transferase [Rhodanobacteraceae bacterium]|nr:glutathione S-transferase [Rhodanobacteraceae bacterium]
MYTLYYGSGAASMLVHLTLLECGVAHLLEPVDLENGQQRSAEYLALNPNGVVPTLLVDGQPHGETAAMAMLLAERHPDARLAPPPGEPGRAAYLQWMLYLANTVQPAFRLWFYPQEFVPDSAAAIKEVARMRLEASWTRLNTHLAAHGPYMLGDAFSVVDLFATMLMRWSRNMPRPASTWPHLDALAQRVKARPSWKQVYEVEGLTEWA